MTDTLEDFLEHYGVKGMQWGVRRKRRSSSDSGGESSSGGSKRSIKSVSDAELQAAVNRMNLEKQYKTLKSQRDEAKRTKTQVLFDEAGKLATNVARTQMTNAANAVVGKAIDDSLLKAGLINPTKAQKAQANKEKEAKASKKKKKKKKNKVDPPPKPTGN